MRNARAIVACLTCWTVALLISQGLAAWAEHSQPSGVGEPAITSSDSSSRQPNSALPRLVVLPWLVIDRSTNRGAVEPGLPQLSPMSEAQQLSFSGMAALDAVLHRHGGLGQLVPKSEWWPFWEQAAPWGWLRQGDGCASCTPASALLRYDRERLQQFGRSVQADYLLLGVAVTPLTEQTDAPDPDDCCHQALTIDRTTILARSSVLLVRVSDGETLWQRDARRLDRDVLRQSSRPIYPPPGERRRPTGEPSFGPVPDMPSAPETPVWIIYSPQERREMAVDETAHLLGSSFLQVHGDIVRSD
jgi:hypothetical protein